MLRIQRENPVSYVLNGVSCGAPGRSRTCDLGLRSPLLYPTELRAHKGRLKRSFILANYGGAFKRD